MDQNEYDLLTSFNNEPKKENQQEKQKRQQN